MHLQYRADIQTDRGLAHYTYDRSYSISGTAIGCGFTGIMWGGWCWAYYGKPYGSEADKFTNDAASELRDKYQIANFEIKWSIIERHGWNEISPRSEINFEKLPALDRHPTSKPSGEND